MSAVSQLIDVKYTDLTNYVDEPGGDVLGLPIFHHWGPVDKVVVYNRSEFFNAYPDAAPFGGVGSIPLNEEEVAVEPAAEAFDEETDPTTEETTPAVKAVSEWATIKLYNAYAQIKRAFELGIREVEVVRPVSGWKYAQLSLDDGTVTPTWMNPPTNKVIPTEVGFSIIGKYPGFPSKTGFLSNYDGILVRVTGEKTLVESTNYYLNPDIYVLGYVKAVDGVEYPGMEKVLAADSHLGYDIAVDVANPIEAFTGMIYNKEESVVDGQSLYVGDILAASDYIMWNGSLKDKSITVGVTNEGYFPIFDLNRPVVSNAREDLVTALTYFEDTLVSSATLLISPINCEEAAASEDVRTNARNELMRIAKERQDLNSVIPLILGDGDLMTAENVNTDYLSLGALRDMFSFYVSAREQYVLWGDRIILDGTGGWCGCTANIAKEVRVNQLASAFTYGAYTGTLTQSLTFDEVCRLHEKGIISIYNSNTGPMIWGVRSTYRRQTSYFAKANVMRVLARILRQIFPIALDAIHTDAAANPITRSNFDVRFSSVVNAEIAEQNLLSDSYATCLGDLNSDVSTKGGKIFNVLLMLHFIGLTEKVKIAVYATDSSVTASIV